MSEATADIVVGLGWGDEGKGATVDFLATEKKAKQVVRFNGGQQAEHNVIANGVHHTFSNFGSGTLGGIPTIISDYCTINPLSALVEKESLSKHLIDETSFIKVEENTKVTTILHIFLNQMKETERGEARHGSTGTGFGETIAWEYNGNEPLRAKDLRNSSRVKEWIEEYSLSNSLEVDSEDINTISSELIGSFFKVYKIFSKDEFLNSLSNGHSVFEGAQGFMLDENFGQQPHTTWSTTTPSNAKKILREARVSEENIDVYGCLRTYATRHGNGPLPNENDVLIPELHNTTNDWAGDFRTASWSKNLLEWSIERVKPDYLAVNHLDVFESIKTDEGLVTPSNFGKVRIEAFGPNREDRRFV